MKDEIIRGFRSVSVPRTLIVSQYEWDFMGSRMPTVVRFENAPLIEVIAELRWNTATDALIQQSVPGMPIQIPDAIGASDELFFTRFAEQMDANEFRTSERLLPYGAPSMPGQPVVRYRRRANVPPLLQVGPGVFTANGLPPTYSHWGDFRPVLRMGVQSLLETRAETERDIPFNLTVRYIDAFNSAFWPSSDRGHFIDEVLGFGSNLPASLKDQLHAERPKSASHQLNLPLSNGSNIVIQVGEGEANAEPVVLLDVVVQSQSVAPHIDAVMSAFENNHKVIRELFVSITKPVMHLLRPIEVEDVSVVS